MADHVDITLWIDRRWKNAIEKHLKGETLQEHLENVLDELCNQLPEQEYKRISAEIYAEDAAEREAREATRTYAAYHVTERGQEWYFKTSPGEELLVACKKLRGYVTAEKGTAPDKFIGMFFGGQPITAKEFDALTAVRMENTGKVRGVFDVNFDKREFSAVHTMDGCHHILKMLFPHDYGAQASGRSVHCCYRSKGYPPRHCRKGCIRCRSDSYCKAQGCLRQSNNTKYLSAYKPHSVF